MYKPTPLFGPQTVQKGRGGVGLCSVVYGIYKPTQLFTHSLRLYHSLTHSLSALIMTREDAVRFIKTLLWEIWDNVKNVLKPGMQRCSSALLGIQL